MKVRATLFNDRIFVQTQTKNDAEFEHAYRSCKTIPGGRWVKAHKSWSYVAAWDVWQAIDAAFPEVEVLEPLSLWLATAQEATEQQAQNALRTDATLVRLPSTNPTLATTLRADQRVGAAWVANAYRGSGIVADDPGCGKTMLTIAGIIEADVQGPILVACPRLSVKPVWAYELRRFGERVYICRGTRAQRTAALEAFAADPSPRKWCVIVVEMLRVKEELNPKTGKPQIAGFEYPILFDRWWSTVIVDESHKAFGSLTVVKGTLAGKGLKRLNILPWSPAAGELPRKIAISGTPFGKGGRVQGMFGTLHWLWPDEFTSFWKWAERHFEVQEEEVYVKGGRGRTRPVKKIGSLRAGLGEEAFLSNLGPRILRRTKAEVLPWLPPKQHVNLMCEMTPAQAKQYQRLLDDGEIVTDNGLVTADGVLAEITRCKQIANGSLTVTEDGQVVFGQDSGKLEMLREKLEARGIYDNDGHIKVIIASQFNTMLQAVAENLSGAGVDFYMMTGSTSDKKRDEMMAAFQADPDVRVFLLNSKAGGVSVTLDAADEMHCLDEMWDPGDNQQLEDRIHRASRNHSVTIFHYITEGTIDQSIAEDVEGKRFKQAAVLDGRRGIAYIREMATYRRPSKDNA